MVRKFTAIILTIVAVLAAGWLALRRADIPFETLEASYTVAGSKFTTLDEDVKVHYADTGPRDAPVIMLVHGYAASLHTWLAWRDILDDSYRVILVDLPGHGLSRAPKDEPVSIDYYATIIDELADRLKVGRFSLAGNSLGGHVAWQYALSHPSDNAQMQRPPALGDSVPASVNLQQANGNTSFAYFYYAGQPVIVDLKTRSIARIGE